MIFVIKTQHTVLANSSSLNSQVRHHNRMQISNMFARNIIIFVPREPILRILNHILQWKRAKTKCKHMVNYRGVKLCEAMCSQQSKPCKPVTFKNAIKTFKTLLTNLLKISIFHNNMA